MESEVNGQWEVEGCRRFGAGRWGSWLLDVVRDDESGEEDEEGPVNRGYHHCKLGGGQEGERGDVG